MLSVTGAPDAYVRNGLLALSLIGFSCLMCGCHDVRGKPVTSVRMSGIVVEAPVV
jgi:hypothetical protein